MKWKIWLRYKKHLMITVVLFLILIILLLTIFTINKWLFMIAMMLIVLGFCLLRN